MPMQAPLVKRTAAGLESSHDSTMLHQLRHNAQTHLRDFDDALGSDRVKKNSTCVHIYNAVLVRGLKSSGEAF